MNRRTAGFLLLAAILAAGCIRLGFWQLSRLEERRMFNAGLAAKISRAPATLEAVLGDTASARYRRIAISGTLDYDREVVLTSRTRHGSPGVNVVTPLRRAGHDTVVLVNRGWLYSPDGMSADLSRWHEGSEVQLTGYVEEFAVATGAVSSPTSSRAVRRMDRDSLTQRIGAPVAPVYIVALGDSLSGAAERAQTAPVRLSLPALDEGAHRSYALQWFAFAFIAVVGGTMVVIKETGVGAGSGERGAGGSRDMGAG